MVANRFGLERYIPAVTRRAVRKRCGFGCVVCGCAIIQYHHFDPAFADAQSHQDTAITLLCGQCHDRTGRGIIAEHDIVAANASPYCMTSGHAKDILFTSNTNLPVRFGSSRVCAATIIKFDDDVVIGLSPSESHNGPLRLNATLTDQNGDELLRVINNEWHVGSTRYDIQTTKDRLKINDGPQNIVLEMSLAAGVELCIERLLMFYRGFRIVASAGTFALTVPSGGTFNHNGNVVADIGLWLKSSGQALVAANLSGGAGVCVGP